ncbi:hypothetical protein ACLKA6_014624 [Drosophila palustris]
MLAAFVGCLLLGIRTCSAQFAIATSSASAGGAVASAGGVSAVAHLPQLGFGSNGLSFNGFGLNANFNPFNILSGNNRRENRPGHRHPPPPPPSPIQWSTSWNGGDRQSWGNGGCGFNCGQTGPGWNGGDVNWEYNSWGSDGGSAAPPGWGNGGRLPPPGWGNGGRPPPGWQHGGRRPPGWQNGGRQPPGWQNGGRQPQPGSGDGNAFPPPGWGDGNEQNPTVPSNTTPDTLISGKNPPPLISPTPPPNQGDTLIVGTNRPPLVPPPQPTPSPPAPTATTYSHSIELSRLRPIIFPSSLQYVANPIEEAPTEGIDIR